jgi:hypothetical protein
VSDWYVEVRVYRHDPREELPLPVAPGLVMSETVRFGNAANATTVAERACKPLRAARDSGVNGLSDKVRPGQKISDAVRAAGLHPLENAGGPGGR